MTILAGFVTGAVFIDAAARLSAIVAMLAAAGLEHLKPAAEAAVVE